MKPDLHEEIRQIIQQYYRMPKSGTEVKPLLDMRCRLACLKYGLSVEVGQLYDEKNGAEYRRKAAFASKRAELIEAKESAAKAETMASAAVAELLKDEMSADAAHRSAWLIFEAVGDVLNAMSQHIANLRQERHEEMTGQGSQN